MKRTKLMLFLVLGITAVLATASPGADKLVGDAENVELIGAYASGPCRALAAAGDIACIANGGFLDVLRLDGSGVVSLQGRALLPATILAIAIEGDRAVVLDWDFLRIVDLSDPSAPQLVGACPHFPCDNEVIIQDGFAFLHSDEYGLLVYDISIPTDPFFAGSYGSEILSAAVAGGLAYLGKPNGLEILDITDPTSPTPIDFISTGMQVSDVVVNGNLLCIGDPGGVRILDRQDPEAPEEVGCLATPDGVQELAVDGVHLYLRGGWPGTGIVDISDPTDPFLAGIYSGTGESVYDIAAWGEGLFLLALGDDGAGVIDAADPALPFETHHQDTFGRTDIVAQQGDMAYIVGYEGSVRIIDVSVPSAPALRGEIPLQSYIHDLAVEGNHLYVANSNLGLKIIDVSDPDAPFVASQIRTFGDATAVALRDGIAYVAIWTQGLQTIDVSDPTAPSHLGIIDTDHYAMDVDIIGDYAYVADFMGDVLIFDVSDPTALFLASTYEIPTWCETLEIEGDRAIVGIQLQFLILDVSDPGNPVLAGSYPEGSGSSGFATYGDFLYVAGSTPNGFLVLDIADPATPLPVGFYETGGGPCSVVANNGLLYVADGGNGLQILRHDPTTVDLDVSLTPHQDPITIPATGGGFFFDAAVANTDDEATAVDLALQAVLPTGDKLTLLTRRNVVIPPGSTLVRHALIQEVPAAAPAGTYVYRLSAVRLGEVVAWDEFTFEKLAGPLGKATVTAWDLKGWDGEPVARAGGHALHGAYPNPFNPQTTIAFSLAGNSVVDLRIFDVAGRLVKELLGGEVLGEGQHQVVWDGRDGSGRSVASGTYFCRIQAGTFTDTRRLALIK